MNPFKKYFVSILSVDDISENSRTLHQVTACLLVEVIHADHDVSEEEFAAMQNLLIQELELSEQEAVAVIDLGKKQVSDATSLYEFTSEINNKYDYGQKCKIIELMWKMALADEVIHHYEEHLIRKVADLIHVSHGDFIRLKLKATDGK